MGFALTRSQKITVAVMMLGTFIAVLNQTIVGPALPQIMAQMQVDASTVQWLTSGFTLVNAIMVPMTAFLTDRFSIRGLFLTNMTIFTLGGVLATFAPNFGVLLGARLLQAVGVGVLQPLVMIVLLKTFPLERRGAAMGMFGIVIAFAPALGPALSGVAVDHGGWRIIFAAVAVLSALVVLAAFAVLERDEAQSSELKMDVMSFVLSTAGFGLLLYGLSAVGSHGFHPIAGLAAVVGIGIIVVFFKRQLKLEVPMLEVRVLKNRDFLVATIITMVVQASIMVSAILMPILMQDYLGMSATVSGLVMMPAAVVLGVMSPIAGKLFDTYGPRMIGIIGITVLTISTGFFATLHVGTTVAFLVLLYTARMFALSLINMPLNTWGMNALPDRLINHGTSVSNTLRQVAGSLGTAVIVSVSSVATNIAVQYHAGISSVEAGIQGINAGFGLATIMCFVALLLTIKFVHKHHYHAESEDHADARHSSTHMQHHASH